MNTSLDNFHDVILPEPVALFPLAEGWYMLLSLFFALLLYFGVKQLRIFSHNRYKREALSALKKINKESDNALKYKSLLHLLRQTAIVTYGRQHIASLDGDAWWSFLNATGPFFITLHQKAAAALLYEEKVPTNETTDSFALACKKWIQKHD